MRPTLVKFTVCALCLLAAARAHAGGLEYVGQGTQALGRGGAVTARADDPMVLSYNPAGLAELRGSHFLFNLTLAEFNACVDAYGYYGWGVYLGGAPFEIRDPETREPEVVRLGSGADDAARAYYTDPLDEVCFDQQHVPIPQIAWTRRLTEDLGIGFGFLFPAVQPSGRWGGPNGEIRGDTGELRPAPTRYQLLSSNNLGLFPTLGLGYRILDSLRIGAAFEWGIIAVNNFTMASSGGGTAPHQDIVAHVKAHDWFVPAVNASIHLVPVDAIDLVVALRWQDDLKASGDIDLTTGIFDPALRSFTTGHIPIESLTQKFPWKLRAGLRYADRFAPRPAGVGRDEADYASRDRIHDPLHDERWDIEVDVEYQLNSRNERQVLDYEDGHRLSFVSEDPMRPPGMADAPTQSIIEKHWKDQISVRAGGTINLLPGLFGVSAGAHYETRGIDPSYMQVDFWPVSRVGLHGGIIIRVARSIDLLVSYAHIFQETITVTPPPHQDRNTIHACWSGSAAPGTMCLAPPGQIVSIDKTAGTIGPDRRPPAPIDEPASEMQGDATGKLQQQLTTTAAGQPAYIINSGRYSSSFDVISAGVNVHF